MNDNWIVSPPLTKEQYSIGSLPGSPVRQDFEISKYPNEFGITNELQWIGLSRQEAANLRNMASSEGLRTLLRSYESGPGWVGKGNMKIEKEDPNDAEFSLMIDSREDIPQSGMNEIVSFIQNYRVQ